MDRRQIKEIVRKELNNMLSEQGSDISDEEIAEGLNKIVDNFSIKELARALDIDENMASWLLDILYDMTADYE